jgi:hypothetical protein
MFNLERVSTISAPWQEDLAADVCPAVETMKLLLQASPNRAASFALAMHERAAWQFDDDLSDYWMCVLALLKRPDTGSECPGHAKCPEGYASA